MASGPPAPGAAPITLRAFTGDARSDRPAIPAHAAAPVRGGHAAGPASRSRQSRARHAALMAGLSSNGERTREGAGACRPRRRKADAGKRAPWMAGMYVLLVEDEALVREMLAEDLADAGLDVAEAPTAEVALAVAAAAAGAGQAPCVLATDVNLGGGMDGLALAAEVRRRWPRVGVVVMTGNPANLDGRRPDPREIRRAKAKTRSRRSGNGSCEGALPSRSA